MLTVKECIELYKSKSNRKVNRLWLCPDIVKEPKIGHEYVAETGINTNQLTESLLNTEVKRHWVENQDTLCIIFVYDQKGPNIFIKSTEDDMIEQVTHRIEE